MSLNRKSRLVTEGDARAPNRAMLRAVGFTDGDFAKPIVGIASGYSTITPATPVSTALHAAPRRRSVPPAPCRSSSAPSP
jgi:dihydroxyacid dehydratase/phosphogluconate dehydratase